MRKREKRRTYDATGRRERALETQERALAVARRLFAERGYAETTMDMIATEAGVAVPTLYTVFGSKRGMLSRLLDRLVSGEPGGPSVLKTAPAKQLLAEPDPRRSIELFARHIAEVLERVSPTYQAMKSAARTESDVAELYAKALRNRFNNLSAVAKHVAAAGSLRTALTVEDAGRTIWVIASPEVRELLMTHAGWSNEKYVAWLTETLTATLLREGVS